MTQTQQDQLEIIKNLLKLIPNDIFIKENISAIIQDGEINIKPVFGLNYFLKSWLDNNSENPDILKDISIFLENYDDFLDYCAQILKFLITNGHIPERDEAWHLDIPIDYMDLVLSLINVQIIDENIFSKMTLPEKKYFDTLSQKIISKKDVLKEFKLEKLTSDYDYNLIDAKIIPIFINSLLKLDDINLEIEKYLNLTQLSDADLAMYDKYATKVIKTNFMEKEKASLLNLAQMLNVGLIRAGEVIYFSNKSEILTKQTLSFEEIKQFSVTLSQALKYCQNENKELNIKILIHQFNSTLLEANNIISIYGKKYELPEKLSHYHKDNLDQASKLVIKYIKEVNENPTIDDLMINLNLDIREASTIFPFINLISSQDIDEDFDTFPEKFKIKIDDLACNILKYKKKAQEELDLISLAYHFEVGIYSIKLALFYITWIENKIADSYIASLKPVDRKNGDEKIKNALQYIKKNDLELSFDVLINNVGYSLQDTHLIIALYNHIISKTVSIENISGKRKEIIEKLARIINIAKRNDEIVSYEPEEVFTLAYNIEHENLDTVYEALSYLKVKVLNILTDSSMIVRSTDLGSITDTSQIQLEETRGVKIGKKEDSTLTRASIEIDTSVKLFKGVSEKVQLRRGIDFVGGLIRYKIAIKNNSEMLINNLDVSLQMTASHIRIVDIKPRVYRAGDRGNVPSMSPGQSESIDFYLEPMICGSIPVTPLMTYMDAFGKIQMVSKESLAVSSKCPLIINPGEENVARVKNIYEGNEIIRSFRSFELKRDPSQVFNSLMEAIGLWANNPVSRPIIENESPFAAEVYYYVLNQYKDPSLGHQEQIIIKIRVVEKENIAIINLGAEKNATVNGVLTHIWQIINNHFMEKYDIKFKSLRCPECGASIENLEKEKDTFKCKYCGEEFQKKALI